MAYPLLQINNLSVDFITDSEKVSAIKNISLEIKKGEIVAIVGESGSGKTVTSLSILRLLSTTAAHFTNGEIFFSEDGNTREDLLQLSEKPLRKIRGNKISMIFQEPMTSLNPVQTCGSQVMEAIILHEKISRTEARQKTLALFNQVKLPDAAAMLDRYPHQVSGGQKQRVMIAMAMSCHPSLLIADEPTTALDVTVQQTILKLIKELQQTTGMSVIYITHDLGLVAEIADEVLVMYKGEIVETNTTREIFLNPLHPYTKALIGCRPSGLSKGRPLPIVTDFLGDPGKREKLSVKNELISTPVSIPFDNTNHVIEVENLKVYFPLKKSFTGKLLTEFKAVDDVSFYVSKGETLGLVGESGCGKTTLGRALIRLIKPSSGNIFFYKKNIAEIPAEQLRKMRQDIQIIFQDPYGSLNPRLTIGQAIGEPMKLHHLPESKSQRKERIVTLLEKVNLKAEHFNRYPHEFSGGQRQRICIARALGLNPKFIICDESVSALDVSVQAQVLNLLNDLKAEFAFTTIFISHDLTVVHYVSDRIMVMKSGKIEETGTADDIYYHPKKFYTQQLVSSIPKIIF